LGANTPRTSGSPAAGASSSVAPQAATTSGSSGAAGSTSSPYDPSAPISAADRISALRAVGLGSSSPRARRLAIARENRMLRRLVARLRGCLTSLDPGARRLLDLRAGVSGPARSAKATARILHVTLRREAIRERRALEALTRSAATGCAGGRADVAPAVALANLPALSASPPNSVSATPARPGSPGVSRASYSSNAPGGGNGATITSSRARTEQAGTPGSFPSAVVTALLGLLLALAMVIAPKLRRRPVAAAAGVAAASRGSRAIEAVASTNGRAPDAPTAPVRQPITPVVKPTDPAIAPMAADAFTTMAGDDEGGREAAGSDQTKDDPAAD
jgi:hypothetical protein